MRKGLFYGLLIIGALSSVFAKVNSTQASVVVATKKVVSGVKELKKEQSKVQAKDGRMADGTKVLLNPDWKYAKFSKITSGEAVFYRAENNVKNITIAVNAGHGTKGGEKVKT